MSVAAGHMGLILRGQLTVIDRIESSSPDPEPSFLLILEAGAGLYPVICPPGFSGSSLEQRLQGLVGTVVALPVISSPSVLHLAAPVFESEG